MDLLVGEARRREEGRAGAPTRGRPCRSPRRAPAWRGLSGSSPSSSSLPAGQLEQVADRRPPRAAGAPATRARRRRPRSPTAPGMARRSRASTSSPSSWRKRSRRTVEDRPRPDLSPPIRSKRQLTASARASSAPPASAAREERLVLLDRAAHRAGGQPGLGVAIEVDVHRTPASCSTSSGGHAISQPVGTATVTGQQDSSQHGAACGARDPGGASRGSPEDMRGDDDRLGSRARAPRGASPARPCRRGRAPSPSPRMPGPGTARRRASQPSVAQAVMERAGVVIASPSPP